MKLYGYTEEEAAKEDFLLNARPHSLAEATVVASPKELRRVAAFLEHAASEMERMGKTYDHIHLSDWDKGFRNSPHLVAAAAQKKN